MAYNIEAAHGFFKELELHYFFLSYRLNFNCSLKTFINKEDLIISLSNIFLNADWLERECFDFFGVKYIYHLDLRRILTDYGFMGHPFLKIFPLTGFIEIRYDDLFNRIIKEKIELSQAFRFFFFLNTWFNFNSYNNKQN